MARRRNSDEPWRELWRQAGTGDLIAARRLVRALERTAHGVELTRSPLTPEEIGDRRSFSILVPVSLDNIPDLREVLLARAVGEDVASANLAGFQAVDVTDDGDVVVRVDLDDVEARRTAAATCVRCETGFPAAAGAAVQLCDTCLLLELESDDGSGCDDWCGRHAPGCDGWCFHRTPDHLNACMNEAQNRQIRRERRESH